ncbi:MAG: helix-turn-helix domain-containing protein [Conexibacter sp.]
MATRSNTSVPDRRAPEPAEGAARAELMRVGAAAARLFAPGCEVVLYSWRRGRGKVAFAAGEGAKARVGEPMPDEVRTVVERGEDVEGALVTQPGGRVLKRSTLLLRDGGEVEGVLCMSLDVTPHMRLVKTLLQMTSFEGAPADASAFVADSFEDTVQSVIAECLYEFGEGTGALSRERKIELIGRLDAKGVFRVQNAVALVGELLGLSRATVYNYLRAARDASEAAERARARA